MVFVCVIELVLITLCIGCMLKMEKFRNTVGQKYQTFSKEDLNRYIKAIADKEKIVTIQYGKYYGYNPRKRF